MLSCAVALFVLISVLSFAATSYAAENTDLIKTDGGIVHGKHFRDGTTVVRPDAWTTAEGCSSSIVADASGKTLRLYSKKGTVSASVIFDEGLDPEDNGEIGIYVRSLANEKCTGTFSVKYENGESVISADLPATDEYYIFSPVRKDAGKITQLIFSVSTDSIISTDKDSSLSVLLRKAVLSKKDHSVIYENYSAFDIDGLDGTTVVKDSPVTASPIIAPDGNRYAVIIKLTGLTGGFAFKLSEDGKNFTVYGSDVIAPDRNTYIIQLDGNVNEYSYRIEFSGTGNDSIKLHGVEFIPIMSHSTESTFGSISKCSISDGNVHIIGSVTRDAAVKHIDDELCLYEIPMWQISDAVLSEEPVMSIKMSTSFSFSLPVSEDFSSLASYVVAIRGSDGVYPISSPLFPSSGNTTELNSDFDAVIGVSPEDAFYADFDNYIIDISVNELFLDKSSDSATVFTFDGYPYYPAKDIASGISLKSRFLSAAGIGIMFRIDNGDLRITENADDCRKYAAAVSYLYDTYSPVGFITDGEDSTDILQKARTTAHIMRLTSSVTENSSLVYSALDATEKTETYAWMLAKYLSYYPRSNYRFILPSASDRINISACAADGGYAHDITALTNDTTADTPYISDFTKGGIPSPGNESIAYFTAGTSPVSAPETVTLWDFTRSYDSDGFTVPSGKSGIVSVPDSRLAEYTGIPTCRSLKTVLGDGSDMVIASPTAPMNLSGYPSVSLLISCVSDSAFAFDIIFISENSRAIFNASFDGSGIYTPVCDLSQTDIADKIERIAIVLREGDSVELAISSVTASGETEGDKEPLYITEPVITTTSAPNTPSDNNSDRLFYGLYTVIGGLTIITILIFVTLNRKEQ